ncbi:MAG: hypothetical protein H7844_02960 [Nitrospirae bacterium YQR-1]
MVKLKKNFYIFAKALLVLLVIWVSFRTINFFTSTAHVGDSGIFVNTGFHMFKGKALYRDAYDHKLPAIFLLNLLAFKIAGPCVNSIYAMERLFAMLIAIAFFLTLLKLFHGNFLIAIVFTLVLLRHFYTPLLFSSGNYTEEYASAFLLTGVFFSLYCTDSEGYKKTLLLIASGLFLSLAVLTKEPFLFLVIPWTGYLFININADIKEKLRLGVIFVSAAILPALLIAAYLTKADLLSYFAEVLSNNLSYSQHYSYKKFGLGVSQIYNIAVGMMVKHMLFILSTDFFFLLGVIGSFSKKYNKEYRYAPLVLLIWFIFGTIGVNITITHFAHYYLQLVAPFTALAASGAVFSACTIKRYFHRFPAQLSTIAVIAIFAICLSVFDWPMVDQFYKRIKRPYKERAPEECSLYIKNNSLSTDYIWSPSYNKYTYIESERLSSTSYIYSLKHLFIDTLKSKGTEKEEQVLNELKKNPPKFIVIGNIVTSEVYIPPTVDSWVKDNYRAKAKFRECLILQRNYE